MKTSFLTRFALAGLCAWLVAPLPSSLLAQDQFQGPPMLEAFDFCARHSRVSPETDIVAWDTLLNGNYSWRFTLHNWSSDAVVDNASIEVFSELNPAFFVIAAFPVTAGPAMLGAGEALILTTLENSKAPVDFTAGFTSSRSMSPLIVPPGESVQTVEITVTPFDPLYATPYAHIELRVGGDVVSVVGPDLSNGETLDIDDPAHGHWMIHKVLLLKSYVFKMDLRVRNTTASYAPHKPTVQIGMTPHDELDHFITGSGSELLISDDDLQGAISYSVAADADWIGRVQKDFVVEYPQVQIPGRIDIKPGSYPNSINLGNKGTVPVAIFTRVEDDGTFDATTIIPSTVTLAGAPVATKKDGTLMASLEDLNADGYLDLIVHFSTAALQLTVADVKAELVGQATDGEEFRARDSVRVLLK